MKKYKHNASLFFLIRIKLEYDKPERMIFFCSRILHTQLNWETRRNPSCENMPNIFLPFVKESKKALLNCALWITKWYSNYTLGPDHMFPIIDLRRTLAIQMKIAHIISLKLVTECIEMNKKRRGVSILLSNNIFFRFFHLSRRR